MSTESKKVIDQNRIKQSQQNDKTRAKQQKKVPDSAKPSTAPSISDRLDGLVVKASALRTEDPGFESRLRLDFLGADSYQ